MRAATLGNTTWPRNLCGSDSLLAGTRIHYQGEGRLTWEVQTGLGKSSRDLTRHPDIPLGASGTITDGACASADSLFIVDGNEICMLWKPGEPVVQQTLGDENFRTWLVNLLSTQKWDSLVICQLSIRMSNGSPGDKLKKKTV